MSEDNRKTVSTKACCANVYQEHKLNDEEKLGALNSHSLHVQIALSPGHLQFSMFIWSGLGMSLVYSGNIEINSYLDMGVDTRGALGAEAPKN